MQQLVMGKELDFYKHHLNEVLLPFWLNRSIDSEYGGYFTCFDNTGSTLVSCDKYTWSQGRMVWVLSRLSRMKGLESNEKQKYINLAASGAGFLMKHCLMSNGNCVFLMDRDGSHKLQDGFTEYDTSIFADCFVLLGLSQYALVTGDTEVKDFVKKLYCSVIGRIDSGSFKSEPYPAPAGYKFHSIPMIMLNVSREVADMLSALGDAGAGEVDGRADMYMNEIMQNFVSRDNILHEMIGLDNSMDMDSLLGRYINPGHTIEDMWFVIHHALKKNDSAIVNKALTVACNAFDRGWDKEYGGLLLFQDCEGGMPRGSIEGMENEKMVHKVTNDWQSKLWWPHSEMLYTFLLGYILTGDGKYADIYKKGYEYIFKVFPNPDRSVGEWIQIRDRKGEPEQRLVALPVKDPFHIIRNVLLIIELIENGRPV